MKIKPKTNSFGTFLETMHSGSPDSRQNVGDALQLWSVLLTKEPELVQDAMRASKMDFTTFAASVDNLRDAGLVELAGEPGHEAIYLTETGKEIARRAVD